MNFLNDTICKGEGQPCLFVCKGEGGPCLIVCLFFFARERQGLVAEFEVLVIGNLEWGPVTVEETKK